MAAEHLFQGIFDKVDLALDSYVLDTAGDIITFITPIFTSLLIIWIAIWGYMMMFGKTSEPLQEGVFRILRIGFIMTFGLTIGTYASVIVNFLSGAPEVIASTITGSPHGTSASALDTLFDNIFDIADAAWEKGGIMKGNFGMYFLSIIIMIIGSMLTVIVAFLILLSKVVTAVLLSIGPIFIIMLLFNSTQRFFENWLSMVVNHGLILILTAAIGQLVINLASDFVSGASGGDPSSMIDLYNITLLSVVLSLCILVVKQVPSIASALGGGIALATQGAVSSAIHAMRPSSIKKQFQGARRDARAVGQAVTSPYRAGNQAYSKAKAAYLKRFGKD